VGEQGTGLQGLSLPRKRKNAKKEGLEDKTYCGEGAEHKKTKRVKKKKKSTIVNSGQFP